LVGSLTGVTVDVSDEASPATKSAALALVEGLQSLKVDARKGSDEADKTLVSLTIGNRR
jgi:hypothetical protein